MTMIPTPTMDRVAATFEAISQQKRFVLVNASDQWMDPQYDGVRMLVPPAGEVVEMSERTPKTVFHSYIDPATGKYVPGTLVVWDIFMPTDLGEKLVWNVTIAIRHCLGLERDTKTKKFVYRGTQGMAGVGVVLDGCSLEEINQVRGGGMDRFKRYSHGVALATIHAFDERNSKRVQQGLPELPPSEEYRKALEVANVIKEAERKALLKTFDLERGDPKVQMDVGGAVTPGGKERAAKEAIPAGAIDLTKQKEEAVAKRKAGVPEIPLT